MAEHTTFKSKETLSHNAVIERLRAVADKLEDGGLTLHTGDQSAHLEPDAPIDFELEVEEEPYPTGKKVEFEIELAWREGSENDEVRLE